MELTQTTSHFARGGRWRARRMRPTRIYLDFKVREVERRPEERAEVRYGGDFPPRLDLLHGNSTSAGHFRSGGIARRVTLTSESGFSGAPRRIRNITNPRKVGSAVHTGLLPSPHTISFNQSRTAGAKQMGGAIPLYCWRGWSDYLNLY